MLVCYFLHFIIVRTVLDALTNGTLEFYQAQKSVFLFYSFHSNISYSFPAAKVSINS